MSSVEVVLSMREADRAGVIRDVVEKRVTQREASARLRLSVRQVKRLAARYRDGGAASLVSGRRGKRSNNAIDPAVRREALGLVRERYPDFGPTFACEKLVEGHGHKLSAETLRGWMIEEGLWQPKARRELRAHPSRPRRECLGDLVQIDGSPHDWFEGRGPRCTLIVYVDDATSRLLALGFWPAETTEAYMETTRAHLASQGRPVAYYSDRCGVFRVNRRGREGDPTQFARALRTLDIASIHAGSPQAKGRVERANLTLGPAGEGDAAAGDLRHRGGERLPAGVPGGLQPAIRRGAAQSRGRAPCGVARRPGAEPDPVRAAHAQVDQEPVDQLRGRHLPGDWTGPGLPAARRRGDGVQGL